MQVDTDLRGSVIGAVAFLKKKINANLLVGKSTLLAFSAGATFYVWQLLRKNVHKKLREGREIAPAKQKQTCIFCATLHECFGIT